MPSEWKQGCMSTSLDMVPSMRAHATDIAGSGPMKLLILCSCQGLRCRTYGRLILNTDAIHMGEDSTR